MQEKGSTNQTESLTKKRLKEITQLKIGNSKKEVVQGGSSAKKGIEKLSE